MEHNTNRNIVRRVGFTRILLTTTYGSDTVFIYSHTGRISYVGAAASHDITPGQLGDVIKNILYMRGTVETRVWDATQENVLLERTRTNCTLNGRPRNAA